MFKRRKPLTLAQTAKEYLWPSMGLRRTLTYIKHRLLRVADTPHKVALGLAIGFGVSFTPLVGTHFIQAGLLAFIFRGNIFAAMVGTFVGNPWTFPFFWWAGFSFGSFLFGILGFDGATNFPDHMTVPILWEMLKTQPMTIFMPWMLGGYILAVCTMPAAYFVYHHLVKSSKAARAKALALRLKKRKKLRNEPSQ